MLCPQFAILGIVSGIVTGLIILLFRSLIELPLVWFLPGNSFEAFENLTAVGRFLLPVSGGLILAGVLIFIPARFYRVGVTHVLERLSRHQGHLPLGNAGNICCKRMSWRTCRTYRTHNVHRCRSRRGRWCDWYHDLA